MSAPAGDERMWTARLRSRAVSAFPPEQLLPDRQPAYVASWIYVFGVATLAALVIVLGSGTDPGPAGSAVVPRVDGRALRQQPAPVERRAVLLHHGHPPVGQVLHGRLARAAGR